MGSDKKDKKDKKEKREAVDDDDEPASKKIRLVSPIANPLADKKLTKKVLKLVKAGAKEKLIRRGVKEVVKALKKGEPGVAVIAGDISPIEVIAHVPILCEEKNIAYVYVPSKEEVCAGTPQTLGLRKATTLVTLCAWFVCSWALLL